MPHSSGGGSHGGGSHGGSHGGSSGNRVSTHYFPGSTRYLKHHHSTGVDEYVYASSKPQKAGIGGVVVIAIMAVVFLFSSVLGVVTSMPKKLAPEYSDRPAVHDNIGVIDNETELLNKLNEYQELTGICTVIYTEIDEIWSDEHPKLESYAYHKYVDEFDDEQHWVIVYSIPLDQASDVLDGRLSVPDYSWEAIQGNDTDLILTEEMFEDFSDIVQENLEAGRGPGKAFCNAFDFAAGDAHKKLDSGSASKYLHIAGSVIPVLFVAGIFIPLLIFAIKAYKKDKDIEYEEVPFEAGEEKQGGLQMGGSTAVYNGKSYTVKEIRYDPNDSSTSKKAGFMMMFFPIPFIVVGALILGVGIFLIASKSAMAMGAFLVIFGLIWLILSILIFTSVCAQIIKANRQRSPVKEENPSSKNSYEDDDDDFRRRKRQGYE